MFNNRNMIVMESHLTNNIEDADEMENCIILCINENQRQRYEIGISVINLKFQTIALSQFNDSSTYSKLISKIAAIEPTEIIVANEFFNIYPLFRLLVENFGNLKISSLQQRLFNKKIGLEFIRNVCILDFRNYSNLLSKNLAIASLSALIKYSEYTNKCSFAPNSLKLTLEEADNTTYVDSNSNKYLELVFNTRYLKSANNLCGVLNFTKTKNGLRSLRSQILQPACDLNVIKTRQDLVEKLVNDNEFFFKLIVLIKKFQHLDEIVMFCYRFNANSLSIKRQDGSLKAIETKIQNIICMKELIEIVKQLKQAIENNDSVIIQDFYKQLFDEDKFDKISNEINKIINSNDNFDSIKNPINLKIQRCFVIKSNTNAFLDVARRNFADGMKEMTDYVDKLSEEKNVLIKLAYNTTRGYFLKINLNLNGNKTKRGFNRSVNSISSLFSTDSLKILEKLPKEFIKVSKTSQALQFTTEKFDRMNDRISECMEDIFLMSNSIINELLQNIQSYLDCFYKLNECISTLDMITSLATYALSLSKHAKPTFCGNFALENSYHPILKSIKDQIIKNNNRNEISNVSNDAPITNSFNLGSLSSFVIITGTNMSGKSTFMKQCGLLQIMAQSGSFVPASNAFFNLRKNILSVHSDYSENTDFKSSFEREILEINYILKNLESNSLILIDELCRSTNYYEGLSLALAICEHLIIAINEQNLSKENKNILILFGTHFREISYLETLYPKVHTYHLKSIEDKNHKLTSTYKLERGVCEIKNYGLKSVELTSFPKSIIEDARNIASKTRINKLFERQPNDTKKKLIFKCVEQLYEMSEIVDKLDNREIVALMDRIRYEFEESYMIEE